MRRVYLVRIYLQWKLFYFFINHFNSLIIMRKLFTTLKSVVAAALVVSMVGVTSCSYDDTDVKNRLDDVEQGLDEVKGDLATLEARVADLEKKVADEVDALKGLIKKQVVVTSVVEENGGITVTLSDGNEFTVYPKTVDTDTDTDTYISVKADETTGVYYWAIFNKDGFVEYLTVGVSDERVPVFQEQEDTCEPIDLKFQVNEATGTIEFSVDGGKTWTDSGVEVGACDCEGTVVSTGACIFKNVVVRDHYVTFTLADGSEVVVFLAELIEFEAGRDHFYVKPGEAKTLPFVVNEQVEDISVMNQPMGWKASVELDEDQSAVVEPAENAYILNIEGPSKERIDAGIADKTGTIQLHITTATGACKVVKVAVDLAEITVDIDAEGNITIVNSWVDAYYQTDWWTGETTLVQEFNNAAVAVIRLEDYNAVNGDLTQLFDEWGSLRDWNTPGETGYFNNLRFNQDNNAPVFVDGVCEKVSFVSHVSDYVSNWNGLEADDSFAVVVIPVDNENQGKPMFDYAVVATYKQLVGKFEEIVEKREFTNAYFNIRLKGADYYYVAWTTVSLVDEYLSYGYYGTTPEEVISAMMYLDYGDVSFVEWTQNWVRVDSNFYDAQDQSFMDFAYSNVCGYTPSLSSETAYYVAVLPVENGRTAYGAADLIVSEFQTATPEYVDATEFKFLGCYDDLNNTGYTGGNRVYKVVAPDTELQVIVNNNYADATKGTLDWGYTYTYAGPANDWVYGDSANFSVSGTLNGTALPEYLWGSTMKVDYDAIRLVITDANGEFLGAVKYEGEVTYDKQGSVDFVPVRVEYDPVLEGNNEAEVAYWVYDAADNCMFVKMNYNKSTDWDTVVTGYYTSADGATKFDIASCGHCQRPNDWNCAAGEKYVKFNVTLTDKSFIEVDAQLPAVEVDKF